MADQNIQPGSIFTTIRERGALANVFALKIPTRAGQGPFGVIEQEFMPLRSIITNDPIWATRWTAGLCRYLSSNKFFGNVPDTSLAAALCVQSFAFSTPSLYTEFLLPYAIDRRSLVRAGYAITDQLYRVYNV